MALPSIKAPKFSPTGAINASVVQAWQVLDPQFLNVFELILYPTAEALLSPANVSLTIGANAVSKIFIKSIEIPSFSSIEYQRENTETHPSQALFTDEFTITFYESDTSIVRKFLILWRNSVMGYSSDFGWIFKDNQKAAQFDAVILPLTGVNSPGITYIQIKGIKFKSMGDVTFDQSASDPLTITATFACDRLDWF